MSGLRMIGTKRERETKTRGRGRPRKYGHAYDAIAGLHEGEYADVAASDHGEALAMQNAIRSKYVGLRVIVSGAMVTIIAVDTPKPRGVKGA